jgi:hypothetical protein
MGGTLVVLMIALAVVTLLSLRQLRMVWSHREEHGSFWASWNGLREQNAVDFNALLVQFHTSKTTSAEPVPEPVMN